MALSLVTAPSAEPVSLTEAKLHVRVGATVTDEDDLIAGLIVAAREYAESFTHRAIPSQTWDLKLSGFPTEIWIPKAPCISVTSITYIATDGTSTVLSASLYTTDLPTGPKARMGRIVPAYQQVWPQTRDVPNAVVVRFVAGYAVTVPSSLTAAMKILIATWYGPAREGIAIGNVVTTIPLAVDALLWPYKSF